MTTGDILNIVVILAVLTITICIALVAFYLVKVLRSVTKLTDDLKATAEDIKQIKDQLKVKFLATFIAIIAGLFGRFIKKRGG